MLNTHETEPFVETYLVGSIPVMDKTVKTMYTRFGDYIGIIFALASSLLLMVGLVVRCVSRKRR